MIGSPGRSPSSSTERGVTAATSGKPVAQIARELGISEEGLRNWKRQAGEMGVSEGRGGRFAQEEEIRRLRRELLRVTEERDILKKATAFFASRSR